LELNRVLRKNKSLLKILRFFLLKKNELKYRHIVAKTKLNTKAIVFASYRGRSYSCSPKSIYQKVLNDPRFSEYKIVWAFRDPKKYSDNPEIKRAILVEYESKQFYQYLAEAKYWILNIRIPEHVFVRPEQIYVQTWHGTPLKRLGCDLDKNNNLLYTEADIFEKYSREGRLVSYFLSPSPFASEKFVTAFNMDDQGKSDAILEAGYPRNDDLVNHTPEEAAEIRAKLGVPENRKVILYAPTWRDNQHDYKLGYVYDINADFDALKAALSEEYVILFRAHYLVANQFNFDRYSGFVYDVSGVDDINDLYLASDLLVTDYSSVFFDYANLNRPVVFYMYDLEQYRDETRGFYLSLDELPGPIVRTESELVEAIRRAALSDPVGDEKYQAFRKKFTPLDDGRASDRVIDTVFGEQTNSNG